MEITKFLNEQSICYLNKNNNNPIDLSDKLAPLTIFSQQQKWQQQQTDSTTKKEETNYLIDNKTTISQFIPNLQQVDSLQETLQQQFVLNALSTTKNNNNTNTVRIFIKFYIFSEI